MVGLGGTDMSVMPSAARLPSHVPPERVRDYGYAKKLTTDRDPYARIAEIHRSWPDIFYDPTGAGGNGCWVVRRMEDARRLYLDTEHFSNSPQGGFGRMIGESWNPLPSGEDPPTHGPYRAILMPEFTPAAMARLEDRVRSCVREYIAGFRDKGCCEVVSEFAFGFPIKVFLELMGLSMDQSPDLLRWAGGLIHSHDIEHARSSARSLAQYVRDLIAERRRNPADDITTHILASTFQGRELTEDEIVGFVFNVFVGGLDTVSASISLHLWHLARRPEHQRHLRANPDKIAMAVEELMRAYAITLSVRLCVKDTEVNGLTVKAGDYLGLHSWLSARDPEAFERPDEVILERNPRHVSFGFGPHLCIGVHLARRELRIALEEFLAMLPEFRLEPDAKITWSLAGVIQPDRLPLVWDC
jgi:cytochrome P450